MAARRRSTKPTGPAPTPPVDPPALAIQRIQQQIDAGRELLKNRPLTEDVSGRWFTLTKQVLVRALGSDHELVERFVGSGSWIVSMVDQGEAYYENERCETVASRISHLEAVIDVLKLEEGGMVEHSDVAPAATSSTRVFVVHGHDDGAKEAVARLLGTFDLEPVILHEQANQGRTLIEKLEAHSDVGFAVVLLTPDDHGAKAGAETRPRARQNVVLELGYFMGKLGRERVCALHKGGIELPSDYDGVVYTPFDDRGAWRFQLASELQAAGFDVDLNKLTKR